MAAPKTLRQFLDSFQNQNSPDSSDANLVLLLEKMTAARARAPHPDMSPITVEEIKERLRWISEVDKYWRERFCFLTKKPASQYAPLNNYQLAVLMNLRGKRQRGDCLASICLGDDGGLDGLLIRLFTLVPLLKKLFFDTTATDRSSVAVPKPTNAAMFRQRINAPALSKEDKKIVARWANAANCIIVRPYIDLMGNIGQLQSFMRHFLGIEPSETHHPEPRPGHDDDQAARRFGRALANVVILAGGPEQLGACADEPEFVTLDTSLGWPSYGFLGCDEEFLEIVRQYEQFLQQERLEEDLEEATEERRRRGAEEDSSASEDSTASEDED
ncbi:hypothetical protein QBC44DRAFT_372418 [Cladorrhinum sp. PSN332]|nr:hypothetical protein QBC44DRAFT_372418 [Cladorrhinum sp. PSN332]